MLDHLTITSYFAADYVSYEEVVENMKKLAESKMFGTSGIPNSMDEMTKENYTQNLKKVVRM